MITRMPLGLELTGVDVVITASERRQAAAGSRYAGATMLAQSRAVEVD